MAKRKPTLTLVEMEMKLGYKVDYPVIRALEFDLAPFNRKENLCRNRQNLSDPFVGEPRHSRDLGHGTCMLQCRLFRHVVLDISHGLTYEKLDIRSLLIDKLNNNSISKNRIATALLRTGYTPR
jgi:hypothetical protein